MCVIDQVMTVDLPKSWKVHPIFHASLLTPYHENKIHGPSKSQPPPDAVKDEEQYEIEGIINHRTRDNKTQYLIKWKGYSHMENEWLHEEELEQHAEELVNKYRTSNNIPKIEPPIKPKKYKRRRTHTSHQISRNYKPQYPDLTPDTYNWDDAAFANMTGDRYIPY
jgi:hypothetical protein